MQTIVDAVYAGRVRVMPGDGRPTGIFKEPVTGAMRVERDGLSADEQADRRFHGGPEQALHHFPAGHFELLARAFADTAAQFVTGSIGENLSTRGWDEADVCIGDVFALGGARVQLSAPRSPCWKIDARYGIEGVTKFIAEHGIAGWYYRVLEPGLLRAGDVMRLIGRNADPVSLRALWELEQSHRPPVDAVQRAADTPGLNPKKRAKLLQRVEWLRRNA
jgi:MOSC domain-containing protein YiiM